KEGNGEPASILDVGEGSAGLNALAHRLGREYGQRFPILRRPFGATAVEALGRLAFRGDPVALFVVDQRMPDMTGVEFLAEALKLFPDAKRVLLTAYADTDAAIRAINEIRLDYYLSKPWEPPEERLDPVLNDLLDDWLAATAPPFEGLRLVGHRWSARSHEIKDFLVRNLVAYQWIDVAADSD